MSEARADIGYHSEMPSREHQEAVRRYLAGEPITRPEPEWKIQEHTRAVGKAGIADTRLYLEALRKMNNNEALTPEEIDAIDRMRPED